MKKSRLGALVLAMTLLFVAGCDAKLTHEEQAAKLPEEPAAEAMKESKTEEKTEPDEMDAPIQAQTPAAETGPEEDGFYGKLQVEGTQLVGVGGNAVQLKGISSHGLSWFPEFVNKGALRQMKEEWGCNVFRLAMYTDDYNGYCNGSDENRETLEDLIDTAVMAAKEQELYIIIDWHILSDYNPLMHKDEAVVFFGTMAEKYSSEDHVIYEICNEPNGDTTWGDIKTYANEVIPAIREFTDAVVLVGTPTWSQDVDKAAADPLDEFDNIMYTLHFYAATHKEGFRTRMQEALSAGLPVFVSEFGICDASGNGAIDEAEADKWLRAMNENNVSFVMWNFSNKDESSAMIESNSKKTSGFTAEDLSQAGKWFVERAVGGAPPAQETAAEESGAGQAAVQVDLANSWESGAGQSYKYTAVLHNETASGIPSWTVTVTFNQDVALQDGWNGKFSIDGNTLTITPQEYNSSIGAGTSLSDIGFILQSAAGLAVVDVALD